MPCLLYTSWDAEIEQTRAANAEAQRKFEAEQAQLDRDSKEAIAADTNLTNIIITDAKLQVDKNGNDYISEDESNSGTPVSYTHLSENDGTVLSIIDITTTKLNEIVTKINSACNASTTGGIGISIFIKTNGTQENLAIIINVI